MRKTIHHNFLGIVRGAELCLESDLISAALILIYSSIDAAAWLWSDPGAEDSTRKNFEAWVNEFMLPATDLDCTATDLYGARCGLIHRLTSESILSAKGKARNICYAYREADVRTLQEKAAGRFIVVHVEALLRAFSEAAVKFIESLGHSNPKRALAFERARSYFVRIGEDDLDLGVMSADGDDGDEG